MTSSDVLDWFNIQTRFHGKQLDMIISNNENENILKLSENHEIWEFMHDAVNSVDFICHK